MYQTQLQQPSRTRVCFCCVSHVVYYRDVADNDRFSSTADAKKALNIRGEDRLLRGRPVSITVPKRFYQRQIELALVGTYVSNIYGGSSHGGSGGDRPARGRVHISAHAKESIAKDSRAANGHSIYSPQDVRSDLQRMSRQHQQRNAVMNGSPEMKKPNKRQSPQVKKSTGKQAVSLMSEATDDVNSMPHGTYEGSSSVIEAGQMTTNEERRGAEAQAENAAETPQITVMKDLSTKEPCPPATLSTSRAKGKVVATKSPTRYVMPGESLDDHPNNDSLVAKLQTTVETTISSNELPASVVEIIPRPIEESMPVEQPSAEVKVDQVKTAEIKVAELEDSQESSTDYNRYEETGSEEEQKHDTNFHSANELQSGVSSSAPNQEKSMPTNHSIVSMPADFGPTTQGVSPSITIILEESNMEKVLHLFEGTHKASTATTTNTTTEASANKSVVPEGKMETMKKSTSKPLVETTLKKGGIQHTQSLHPFAKPNKTQRQKEREQRKKDEKKKKAEQAEKAKTEKASASIKLIVTANGELNKNQSLAQTPESSKSGAKTTASDQKNARAKEVGGKASTCTAAEDSNAKDGDGDAGKHTGNTTTSPPKEIGSVTEKTEAQSIMTTDSTANGFLQTPSSIIAQPSERVSTSAGHIPQDRTVKLERPQSFQMSKKTVPAIPILDFHSRKSPPLKKNSQMSVTTNSSALKSTQPDTVTSESTFEGMNLMESVRPMFCSQESTGVPSVSDMSHTVSYTGSAVPQSEGEAQASPSPTSASSYTPMHMAMTQTGGGEVDGCRKKKKKKPKKKKQAVSPEDSGSGTESVQGSYNPFNSQLLYIDAIKKATTNKEHYFNQNNAEAGGRGEKAAKVEATSGAHKV